MRLRTHYLESWPQNKESEMRRFATAALVGVIGCGLAFGEPVDAPEVVPPFLYQSSIVLYETSYELVLDGFSFDEESGEVRFDGTLTAGEGDAVGVTILGTSSDVLAHRAGRSEVVLSGENVFTLEVGDDADVVDMTVHYIDVEGGGDEEVIENVSQSMTRAQMTTFVFQPATFRGPFVRSLELEEPEVAKASVMVVDYLNDIIGGTGDLVTFLQCVRAATDACMKECPRVDAPGTVLEPCVGSVTYSPDGSCSFTCQTFDQCCDG